MIAEERVLPETKEAVTILTSPHGVTTPDGREEFTMRRDQLIR
ncbi:MULTISPECIES: hypothetical protein [Streptomyces]|nr:hypothetical protein [Streptomyces sp. MCA2]